jgi:exodeoxyribonuclease V gamma subunit
MVLSRNRLIQKRFNFTDEALDQIDNWLDDAGVRWGIDAEHKQELGLSASPGNTWRAGLDRLLLGAALPKKVNPELPLFHNVLPVDEIEGGLTLLLSEFVNFCDLLFEWREVLKQNYRMEKWQFLLQKILEDFFVIDELEEANYLQLLEMLDQLKHQTQQSGYESALCIQAVIVLLKENIVSAARSGRLSGRVNFTSMNSLTGVPFKHICLLGMNYDAWPTQQREPGFDLLQSQSSENLRCGDRNKANDERYLTLQLILAAQDSLYLSYVGRNIHNGEKVPPSVLVSELLDCCTQNAIAMQEHQHAMHTYSADNFTSASKLRSHDEKWLAVAQRVGQGRKVFPRLFEDKLESIKPVMAIEFEDLCNFYRNPQNSFLRSSLGIYIKDESNDWDNVEPFNLANFADSDIRSIALQQAMVGKANTSMAMAQASGKLPHGLHGEILQCIEQETVDELLEDLESAFLQKVLEPIVVDLQINGINIAGVLRDLRPEGQLLLITDQLYHWQKIQVWLRHLLLCCIKPEGVECVTRITSLSGELVFNYTESAQEHLTEWLKAYCTGLNQPLAFFSKVSFAYAENYDATAEDNWLAQNAAKVVWESSYASSGECSKPANAFLYRGHSPLDSEFEKLAQTLLCPLIQAGSSNDE